MVVQVADMGAVVEGMLVLYMYMYANHTILFFILYTNSTVHVHDRTTIIYKPT